MSSSGRDRNVRKPSAKRQRALDDGGAERSPGMTKSTNFHVITDIQENETNPIAVNDYCTSVESILGIPVEILFRQVGGEEREIDGGKSCSNMLPGDRNRRRPLLTRPEVEKFLRVTLLAQEIDILVDLAGNVLERRQCAKRIRRDLLLQGVYQEEKEPNTTRNTAPWKNPWLTTLGPILDVLEERQPQPIQRQHQVSNENNHQNMLYHIHDRMTQLCHDLQSFCVSDLKNSADQNRECFMHMIDYEKEEEEGNRKKSTVQILAQEKIALAELQDHLSKRIRSFLKIFCFPRDNDDDHGDGGHENNVNSDFIKMKGTPSSPSSSSSSKKKLFAATTATTQSEKNNTDNQLSSSSSSSSLSTVIRAGGGNKKRNNTNYDDRYDGDLGSDDNHSLLSLEEVMTPLKYFCEKLFTSSNLSANDNDKSEKEVSVSSKQQQENRKLEPSQNGNESSSRSIRMGSVITDNSTMIVAATSQKAAGVAAVMITLANKHKVNKYDVHKHGLHNYNNRSHEPTSIHCQQKEEQKVEDGHKSKENKNNPLKYSASDDSSVDDPLEDGDSADKGKATDNDKIDDKDNSKVNKSQQEALRQEKKNERRKFDRSNGNNCHQHDYRNEHLSSLTSESQTAAEALTLMIHGNSIPLK